MKINLINLGVTGSGRCAQGSLEILELLPHIYINDLQTLEKIYEKAKENPTKHNKVIYILKLTTDKIMRKYENPDLKFEKKEYYKHPEKFYSIFQDKYLKYLSVFVNAIYWEDRYPRLIRKKFLQNYYL